MLNPYHLKYFCDACRLRSISEAAKRNYVSHSAVSQAIRSLENQVGVSLLAHAKRQFEITPQGNSLHLWAETILAQLDSLPVLTARAGAPLQGKLRIGVSQSLWNAMLESAAAAFLTKHPGVQLGLSVGNSAALANLLKNREIDLGFGVDDESFASLDRHEIRRGKFVLASHPEISRPGHYLLGDKGEEVRMVMQAFRAKGETPEISTVQSWSMILSLVQEGLGIGLIPDFCLPKSTALKKNVGIRLPDYQLFAYFRAKANLPPAARSFVSSISKTFT